MVATPRGDASSMTALSPYAVSVSYTAAMQAPGSGSDWFGPLRPANPVAPPEVWGRVWDYPAGFNLPFSPRQYEAIDFATLRALADTWDLLRLVIETRKDQMARLDWTITAKDQKYRRPGAKVPAALQARAAEIVKFFQKPDGATKWRVWLRELLEDHFVIDAATLLCERTRAGALTGLVPMDGGTIKRIIDNQGRTPRPYEGSVLTPEQTALGFQAFNGLIYPPAYQQRLKNLPAVNYTTRGLMYLPENVRTNKAYGFSRVEQIIMTVNIALRRQMFTLAHYTEGNIPESLIGVPDAWNPDQIKAFQDYWDAYFTGNTAARRRAKFVPGGVAKTFIQTKEPELKNVFDEWLARVVCFAFSISPQPFTAQVNRATAQVAKQQSSEEGAESTKDFVKSTVDGIICDDFAEPELEFRWAEEQPVDPETQETILSGYAKSAIMTLNESREDLGRDPYPNPEASQPMVLTATGYVPLEAWQKGQDRADTLSEAGGDTGVAGGGAAGGGRSGREGAGPSGGGRTSRGDDGKDAGSARADGGGAAKRLDGLFDKAARRAGRRLAPIPFARRAMRKAQAGIRAAFVKAFDALSVSVADAVRDAGLAKAKGSNREDADDIADGLDLSALDGVTEDVIAAIEGARADTGMRAIAQLGVTDNEAIVDQVNEDAARYAARQAATLIKDLDRTTRDIVRDVIASGLEDNIGLDAIIENLAESGVFSEDRADLIARTEITDANSEAALDGYKSARDDAGVAVRKAWILGPNPCVICEENADAGDIDLDEEFPSGDDAPSAHPNCECALSPVVEA